MLKRLAVISLILVLIVTVIYLLLMKVTNLTRASFDWQIIPSIFIISLLSSVIVIKIGEIDKNYFFAAILASIVLKLLIFAALNFAWIYFDREGAIGNIVLFFTQYLLFTLVETGYLFNSIRKS